MYKEDYRISRFLKIFKSRLQWLIRKLILVFAAVMIGFSNVIYEKDDMINVFKDQIEQQQEKDKEN